MNDILKIWEFTVHHSSGNRYSYQLELRDERLELFSDDPDYPRRKRENRREKVLDLLKALLESDGMPLDRQSLENRVFGDRAAANTLNAHLSWLRDLLLGRQAGTRDGKAARYQIIESLTGGLIRFLPEVRHTPAARIQKTALLSRFSSIPSNDRLFDRPDELEPVIQMLTRTVGGFDVVAIEGMPGLGKTMLAVATCHDPRVRDAFSDGIIWLKCGPDFAHDVTKHVEFICKQLNARFEAYTQAAYRTLLQDKAVLVVLDDVWDAADVDALRVVSARSKLLYTARDKAIGNSLRIAHRHEVTLLKPPEDRQFLLYWSGGGDRLPAIASDILRECDGLPLALAMIGAAVAQRPEAVWRRLLADLTKSRLKNIGKTADYQHPSLYAAIAVSIDALPAPHKERYLRLASWLDNVPASLPVLQALWGEADPDEAQRTVDLLTARGLARLEADGIVVHGLQLKFLRGEHPEPRLLALQRAAIRRGVHIFSEDPEQFCSQIIGRLLIEADDPRISTFLRQLEAGAPQIWLRPILSGLDGVDNPIIRILRGHSGPINAVAFSPDEELAVTGSDDGSVIVWNLKEGVIARHLFGHEGPVTTLAVSRDGQTIVSGCKDGTIRIWSIDGRVLLESRGFRSSGVTRIAISADAKRIVAGSNESQSPAFWDLAVEAEPLYLEGHNSTVTAVAMLASGTAFLTASFEGRLLLWHPDEAERPRLLENGHGGFVTALALGENDTRCLSGGWDGLLILWDLIAAKPLFSCEGHIAPIDAVALTPDGTRAISAADHRLIVWDLKIGRLPFELELNAPDSIKGLALSADGERALSGLADGTLVEWNFQRVNARPPKGHWHGVFSIALSAGAERVISCSLDHSAFLWTPCSNTEPVILQGHDSQVTSVAISANGKRGVSGSWDQNLLVWDLDHIPNHQVLSGHGHYISAVAMTPDGDQVVSGSGSGEVFLWNLASGNRSRILKGNSAVQAVALAANGRRVASASCYDVTIWDVDKPEPRAFNRHPGLITSVCVTADGSWAASGDDAGTVILWHLAGHLEPRVLEFQGKIEALALAPDALHLVVCVANKVMVLDLKSTRRVTTFTCDASTKVCATSWPLIAVGDVRGRIHVLAFERRKNELTEQSMSRGWLLP